MSKNRFGNFLIGLGVSSAVFWFMRKASAMETLYKAPRKLSAHFDLSEFVSQHDDLKSYGLTAAMLGNVERLAGRILEPARITFGPIIINSGGRPMDLLTSKPTYTKSAAGQPVTLPAGVTLDQIVTAQGYHPSPTSDHHDFSGADIRFPALDTLAPEERARRYAEAAIFLARLPDTRQVIVYYARQPDGSSAPVDIHVAVMGPGKGKIASPNYAFAMLDGKRFPGELDWRNKEIPRA